MDTENVVVTKQDRKYKTLVTDIGKEKMTNAILNGKKVNVVMAAVGDGGGSYYLPTATPFRLGGVKVGDGLTVDNEGKLSVDAANTEETTGALNEVFGAEDGK